MTHALWPMMSAFVESSSLERGLVLVVGCTPSNQTRISAALRREGYECASAVDADGALRLLLDERVDVVLIDVSDPDVHGFSLLQTLHDVESFAVPIVLTRAGEIECGTRAIGLGAFDFIEIPDRLRSLADVVRHAGSYSRSLRDRLAIATESEAWETVFEAFQDAIVIVDVHGRIRGCNAAAVRRFSRPRGDLLGGTCHEILCADTHAADACPLAQPTSPDAPWSTTLKLGDATLEISALGLPNRAGEDSGRVVVIRDSTTYQRALEAIQSSESWYRLLYHGSRDAIVTAEPPAWKFTMCNRAAADMFGFATEADCVHYGPWDVSPEYQPDGRRSAELAREKIELALTTGTAFFEWRHRRLDGTEFPASVLLTRVQQDGGVFVLSTVRDISAQKEVEAALEAARSGLEHAVEERTQELAAANAELRSAVAARDRTDRALREVNRRLLLVSECNQLIVRAADERQLLGETLEILVNSGGYSMAWAAIADDADDTHMRLMTRRGIEFDGEEGWREACRSLAAATHHCCDPAGPGAVTTISDLRAQSFTDPWSMEAIRRGCTCHFALSLCNEGKRFGVIGLYTEESGSAVTAESLMLNELASDLGFALASFRSRAQNRRTQGRLVTLGALKERLLDTTTLQEKLQQITDSVVDVFGADFARIWMIGDGDRCANGCVHAGVTDGPNVCRRRETCLHLKSSSGRYTHLDGAHGRVPVGCFKIGKIASGDVSEFMTNDVAHDPRVHNHAWAQSLGLVSFAGWRLLSPQGKPVGVLAFFSKHRITPDDARLLEDVATTASHVIVTGIAAHALEESESKLDAIFRGCPIPQFAIDRNHKVMYWNRPLEEYSGVLERDIVGTSGHWRPFYDEQRPCLVDFLVEEDIESIQQWYPGRVQSSNLGVEAYETVVSVEGVHDKARWLHVTAAAIRDKRGNVIGAVETLEDITEHLATEAALRQSRDQLELRVRERTKELADLNTNLQSEIQRRLTIEAATRKVSRETERLMESMSSFLIALNSEQRVTRWNAAAEHLFGIPALRVIGEALEDCGLSWDWGAIAKHVPYWPNVDGTVRIPEVRYERTDGSEGFLSLTMDAVRSELGEHDGLFLLGTDITNRRNLEVQLLHAQKLESVGRLAAGIAHEINTPIQYVGDNVEFLRSAYEDFRNLVGVLREIVDENAHDGATRATLDRAMGMFDPENVDYLMDEIPKAIAQSSDGVSRVASIVRAMKEFSHPGTDEMTAVDLNRCIESTVTVSRNEWKYVADLETDLDSNLPPVMCLPGEFNQVVLNMIVNAAHAIEEANRDAGMKGRIVIRTRPVAEWVEVVVSDTGCGIPEDARARIFDPFFTTKEVGRGTGQGLAIARHVVVDKFHGTIDVETKVGEGTTFVVRLPRQTQEG